MNFADGLSVHPHRRSMQQSEREIIRCLKRFVAREIFGYLCRRTGAIHPEQIAA